MKSPVIEALILSIAQKHLRGARGEDQIVTFAARNSDSLDFLEQFSTSIGDAMREAFEAGRDFEVKRIAAGVKTRAKPSKRASSPS